MVIIIEYPTTRKSLYKKRRKFIDWQRSDRLWLMDSFTSLLTVVWPNAIPVYTFIQKTPRVWRSRERKKSPISKEKTNTHSKKPHDLSNWAIYLDHHGVKMYKWIGEWDLPEGSRRLKGLSPGACSSVSRRGRHCRRSLWGREPGSRRWAGPTRTDRNTPSVPCGGPSLSADHSHSRRWSETTVWML